MFREILVNIENKYANIFNNGLFYRSPWNDINGYYDFYSLTNTF